MKTKNLILTVLLGLFGLIFITCSSDDDGGGDADSICNVEACATNSSFKTVCIDEYNDCIERGGDPDQCAAAATETCTL